MKKSPLNQMKPFNADVAIFGLETVAVGLYFILQQPFQDDIHNHAVHLSFLLPSPLYCTVLVVLGVLAIIASFGMKAKTWLTLITLLSITWTLNILALAAQSLRFGHHIGLSTILAAFVLVRIVASAKIGRWYHE